ncbi:MAG: TrbC/VirB2 family protein [Candidatus Nomurabacteria bacterium]|nr:MAG: TrbC/VirB2 family protein [Candidatus Nomurabacteria bacterium]
MRFLPVIALIVLLFVSPDASVGAGLAPNCAGATCGSCDVVAMANNIVKWLIGVLFVIFAIMVAAGGFGLVTSGGNQAAKEAAKSRISNAIIGIVLVLAAWLLVDTLMRALLSGTEGKINGNFWYTIECTQQTATEDVPSEEIKMPEDANGDPVADCSNPASLIAKFNGSPQGVEDNPALRTMINCYLADPGIAALVDTSKIFTYDQSHPICANTNGNPVCGPCSHSRGSCHYGRGSGKGAQAVDFNAKGNAENELYKLIKAKQGVCGGKLNPEGNHTHISLDTCGS